MRGLPSKVLADRLEQIEKKKKEEEKTKKASKKTSTEEARHKNSSSSKNSGSKAKIRGVQSPRKDSEKDDSLKEHRTALSQRNNKPLYSYRGNAVYTPAIKGAQVLNANDPRNDATYLARGVGLGMGSLVSDWNKDRKANMERYNAGVNKNIGRVTPTMQSAQNAGAVKKYDLEGGVVNDAARKFENFYNRESEKYWSDPRSQELGSKLAYGGGRLAADLGLMALPGISGEIRTGARVADKALNFLTNPVRNPWSLMSNVSAYRGNRYDEARKAGADVTTAAKAADTYAAVQAYTQALGGAERAFNNPSTASTLKRIVSAGAQEAVEEPLQMPWENWSKTLYGKNVPLYAEGKDENGNYREAVINPDAMKEAALLGGILGAAGGAVGAVRNPSRETPTVAEATGRSLGVSEPFLRKAAALERALGKGIVFENTAPVVYSDGTMDVIHGYADESDGMIHVNINGGDPEWSIIAHEMTHFLEKMESYDGLHQNALDYFGDNAENIRNELRQSYSEEEIESELVARFVERELLTNYDAILNVAQTNPSLMQQMINWIRDIIRKIGKSEEARTLIEAERNWTRAYQQARQQGSSVDRNKFLFAGRHSEAANVSRLTDAFIMEQQGATNYEIHNKTGWWKNPDGEWRYEIDDSEIELLDFVHNSSPHADEFLELYAKFNDSEQEMSQDEFDRLGYLTRNDPTAQKLATNRFNLDEVIRHDELFNAYPMLRNIVVSFRDYGTSYGSYAPGEITIKKSLLSDEKDFKETIIHEIQHAIQDIEGFASGSSPDGWMLSDMSSGGAITDRLNSVKRDILKRVHIADFDAWRDAKDYLALQEKYLNAVNNLLKGDKEFDEFFASQDHRRMEDIRARHDHERWFQELSYINSLLHGDDGSTDYYKMYRDTAGEIEARNAEHRSSFGNDDRMRLRPIATEDSHALFYDSTHFPFRDEAWEAYRKYGTIPSLNYYGNNGFNLDPSYNQSQDKISSHVYDSSDIDEYLPDDILLDDTDNLFDDDLLGDDFYESRRNGRRQYAKTRVKVHPEDRDGTLDRGHAQTAFTREVEQNNDEMAQTILDEAEKDYSPLRRGVYTDKQAQRNVWAELEGKSIEQAVSEFIAESAAVSGNTPRLKDLVTKGLDVYVQAVNDGDIELATRMLTANSVLGTELGRGVQAYSQLRKLTPEGRLAHLNAAVRQQARKNTGYDGVEVRERAEDAVVQELPRIIDDFANDAPMEESSGNYENATIAKKVDELRKKAGTEDKYVYRRGTQKGKGNDKTHIVTAKKIIAEGLKANEIDLAKAIRNGDVDEVTATLVEYAESRFDDKLSSDKLLDLTVEIHEEICERVRKYRDGVFKNLAGKEFKGKGQKFIQKLREFNNMGAFDDPETGRLVYDHLGVPVMQEDVAEMILDLSYLSKEISDNPNAPIESDFLTDEEIDALEAARDKHGADYVVGAIERKAEETALDLVKSTGWQKVRQYQLTSMLLNLKTMLRNVTPNIGMAGMNVVGDLGATVLDKQLAKKTGYRTKGTPNIKTAIKGAKKGASEALTDYKLGVDTSQGNTVELSKRRHFEGGNVASRTMNRATDLMGLGLQLGDRPFENAYRNISLENQMKLNNLDEPTALMKELADIEAIERTFKDDNKLTEAVQKIVSTLNGGKEFGFGSMMVPFVRTPVNLTKTVFQYSPAGAVNVAVDAWNYKNAVNEEAKIKAQHKLVNDFSKLISGVILGAMVIALKESDLVDIYGGEDDEESYDRRNYNKQVHGFQPYSIRIGDKYYNYGNLQPIGSIMAMTVDSFDSLTDNETDGDFIKNIAEGAVNAIVSSGDLLYEQSFIKSFANLFNSNDGFVSALVDTALTFPSQFNPAILQQFARVLDPYKRNTQDENPLKEGLNKFVNNVPFASKTLPEQVDAYGTAVERFDGGTVSDVFNAFANPITVTKHKETAVTNEIERLEATTGESLIPKTVGTSIEFGNKNIRLTGDEQSELNKKIGSDTNSALSELFASEGYASLSETDKAKAAMNVRDSIANAYKAEFLNSKGYAKTVTKKQQAMIDAPNHGLSVAEFAVHDAMISSFDDMEFADDLAKSSAKRIYILNSGLGSEGAVYMIQSEGLFDSENHNINMTNAKNADNISNEDYILAYTAAKAYESIDDNYDKRLADTISFISGMKHLDSDQQKSLFNYVFNRYKMTYDDSDIDFSSGDVTTILMGVQGKKFQEVWNGNNKYINYDIKSLGYESSDWLAMYNWANANAEGTSKAAYEAAVDKIDAPADVKKALVAMRNFKPSGGYSDGGSVSLEEINKSYSAEVTPWDDVVSTVNAAKPAGTYNLATPEEKARRDARKSLDSWGGASKIVNPVGYDGQYVTGEYGEDRGDHAHAGIDIGVDGKDGISAHSVMSGEVVSVGSKGGYGNTVIIKNDDGYYCLYGHLASYADLKAGDRVTAGQQIGVVGSTGRSSGNHLHFEVRSGSASGNAVDPNSVYDIDGDGVLTNGNSQSLGTGTADPNYSGKSSASSGSSSFSSSSGSSGSSGGRSGTLARSISSKKRYGYTPGSTSFNFGGNTSRRWVQ